MRYFVVLFSFLTFVLADDVSQAFKIEGMHCGYGCVNKVKSVINSLEGVKKCEVDFNKSLMTVEYDDTKVNPDLIVSTITEKTTYETRKVEDKKEKRSFWDKLKGIFS